MTSPNLPPGLLLFVLEGHEPRQAKSLDEWGEFMEKQDRFLAQEVLADGSMVSTVFLGTAMPHAPNLLFETAHFLSSDNPSDTIEILKHYATWKDAMEGHAMFSTALRLLQKELGE